MKDCFRMRWTPAPFTSVLFFILLTIAGLLLDLTPVASVAMSLAWMIAIVCAAMLFSKKENSASSPSATATLASSKGVGILLSAFSLSVALTFFVIYAFDYLAPTTPTETASLFSESAEGIHFLIALLLCGIAYALSDMISQKKFERAITQSIPTLASELSINKMQNKALPDMSLLEDGRAYDIAKIGIFDGKYALPDFYIREIKHLAQDASDDVIRQKSKKAIETLKKLETLPSHSFEILKTEYSYHEDLSLSLTDLLLQFATEHQSKIITIEPLLYKSDGEHSPYVLSLDAIAAATKNSLPKGEYFSIKIQRLGKEPKQGIGYLEDGTMVVVNGGGDYLGKTIKTQFLSQKYSTSGKIIFCNAMSILEEEAQAFSQGTTNSGSSSPMVQRNSNYMIPSQMTSAYYSHESHQ